MPSLSQDAARVAVDRLTATAKYRHISAETVADVVAQELGHAADPADLEQRSRLRLHKITAGYLMKVRPARVLRGLDEAIAAGPEPLRAWCRTVLEGHFSTAERLPDLDRLYPTVLAMTGGATSIADLACALNPFTLPWLRVETSAPYTGYDLNRVYVDLATAFLARVDDRATVRHCEVLTHAAEIDADVVFLMKTYHCIEQRREEAALQLVDDLDVRCVVVTFPVRTMSGRVAHFTDVHIGRLAELSEARGWVMRRNRLGAEELVVLHKHD